MVLVRWLVTSWAPGNGEPAATVLPPSELSVMAAIDGVLGLRPRRSCNARGPGFRHSAAAKCRCPLTASDQAAMFQARSALPVAQRCFDALV